MCNYLHLQASSVQITSTFCFEVPLGAAMLVHFLPLKGWAKGLDTLFASECQKVLAHYTFASEGQKVPKHLILLPHILAVLTLILMPVILVIVIHTAECKMAALPFDHIHVFTTIKSQRLKKKDEKQSWPSHNSFCATGRLEWKKFENVPLVFSCCFPSDLKGKNPRVPMSNNYWGEMFKTAPWSTALWLCAVVYSWYCCLFDSSLCFLSVSGSASMHHTPQLLGCTDSTEKRTCVLISWK